MDSSLPEFIKLFLSIGTPIGALLGYFVRENKTAMLALDVKINKLEDRVAVSETNTAVINTKLDSLKENIHEIKRGVNELVDTKRHQP